MHAFHAYVRTHIHPSSTEVRTYASHIYAYARTHMHTLTRTHTHARTHTHPINQSHHTQHCGACGYSRRHFPHRGSAVLCALRGEAPGPGAGTRRHLQHMNAHTRALTHAQSLNHSLTPHTVLWGVRTFSALFSSWEGCCALCAAWGSSRASHRDKKTPTTRAHVHCGLVCGRACIVRAWVWLPLFVCVSRNMQRYAHARIHTHTRTHTHTHTLVLMHTHTRTHTHARARIAFTYTFSYTQYTPTHSACHHSRIPWLGLQRARLRRVALLWSIRAVRTVGVREERAGVWVVKVWGGSVGGKDMGAAVDPEIPG